MFHLLGLLLLLWLGWLLIVGLWHVFVFLLSLLGIGIFFLFVADPATRASAILWIVGIVFIVVIMGLFEKLGSQNKRGQDE
ncbi:hypothetical protein SAMN05216296_0050 [Pseudomonas pohangensis]|uniref:Uncharacterized protein n=1 Tax=Pseudomonas pohangensis TaxID=364197 RepID=A0A1H2DVC5_9PSED|nr:hypothetical protein [Pseudomonas pohangensis]SDT86817.1 hypothetical protein SAMN05216296_0050 [Pseudomonas pohangensis]